MLGVTLATTSRVAEEGGGASQPPVSGGVRNVVMLGQSEPHRLFLSTHADVGSAGTVADESALEIWWYDLDTSSPNNATGVKRDAITNANKVSRWAVDMSNALAALAPGVSFKLACLLFAGTGLDDLLDDANVSGARYWSRSAPYNGDKDVYDQFIADTGIAQPDAAFMSWSNTDSTQIQYQSGDAWWAALTGTQLDDGSAITLGTNHYNVDYDHFLSEMWDTESVPFTLLMHRYDVFTGSTIDWDRFRDVRVSLDRMVESTRNQDRITPFLRGIDPNAYENGYDVGDDSHPLKAADGATKFAQQLAYNMVHMTGAATTVAPQIDALAWTATNVTLSCLAGNITTTRMLRGGVLPSGQPKVAQLYFRRADDAGTLHEVVDAAISITGGDIVVDAATLLGAIGAGRSNFLRGDMLEFASGAAGANDAQDKTDDTWLDYPGIANGTLELIPLRPEDGVLTCDIGSPPALTNTITADFATWAAAEGMVDQGDGFYPTISANHQFRSADGEIDTASLTGGVDSATLIVDLDRTSGLDSGNSTQVSLRDMATYGHQKVKATGLWSDVSVEAVATGTAPTTFGAIPLPNGRTRLWAHVSIGTGALILYLNNSATGGAYGGVYLIDGALDEATIAAC